MLGNRRKERVGQSPNVRVRLKASELEDQAGASPETVKEPGITPTVQLRECFQMLKTEQNRRWAIYIALNRLLGRDHWPAQMC
jgi:hypothetical protein